jgi:2-keto-4-pentenoate hydratase/2-oxohepta-3-ene-1,7-dioic acid hydratase in catechol pathway
MKLVRFSAAGSEPRLGAVAGPWDRWEWIVDLSGVDPAIPSDTLAFIDACGELRGEVWDRAVQAASLAEGIGPDPPSWAFRPRDVRVHSPILPRLLRDFLAFRAHVARTRAAAWTAIPPEWDWLPGYYNGNHLNVVGTGEEIQPMRYETFDGKTPRLVLSPKMDYEAEIGFVLGKGGRDIEASKATGHLFGVTIFNDFSARDIQAVAGKIGMGPAPGKDWANALGPCIVTRDEFGELRDQAIVVRVNNEERLRDRYRNMVFENPWVREGARALWSFPEMVECLSRIQPIRSGELWGSGTIPGGCELERGDRARYLKPGDRVEIEIEGIGVLANSIASA